MRLFYLPFQTAPLPGFYNLRRAVSSSPTKIPHILDPGPGTPGTMFGHRFSLHDPPLALVAILTDQPEVPGVIRLPADEHAPMPVTDLGMLNGPFIFLATNGHLNILL